MKKGDFIWAILFILVAVFLILPVTHHIFLNASTQYPYISGFIKFALLATMGELLAIRILERSWKKPAGLIFRIVVWGLIGMLIVLMFQIFSQGVSIAMKNGYLPGQGSGLLFAFLSSTTLNLTFAPTFMGFHRLSDTYIDLRFQGDGTKPGIKEVANAVDWNSFISFVLLRTVPCFWIPAHTITFLLPPQYRVLMAAFLSLALGCILSFAKRKG